MCRSCLELLPGVPLSVMFDPHVPWLSTLRVESSRMLSVNAYVTQHSDVHLELPLSSALCTRSRSRSIYRDAALRCAPCVKEWCLSTRLHVHTPTPPEIYPTPRLTVVAVHAQH